MMQTRKITIVGGGLVGAMLSVMLSRRGYEVTVFEKRPDMRKVKIPAGRSINLALAQRGIHALKTAGLMPQVEPLLIPMAGRMLHDLGHAEEFSPYGQRPHEVIYSVSRPLLNQVMLTAADTSPRTTLHFEHECIAVDLRDKKLELRNLADGSQRTHHFDILLATDGANSVVRDAIVRSAGGTWKTDWLDHDYKELCLPAGPNGEYQLDKNSLHIWPRKGYMLIALPNLDGSFTVTLFLNKEGQPSFASLTERSAVHEFFSAQFPDVTRLIPTLEDEFFGNPTGVLGTVRATRWASPDGNALLLGDAAHAIVPFHGQGMNAGFEDCGELLRLLDKHREDWAAVLPEFESIRRPNGDAIADLALENYITMRDSVLDPRFQLKKLLGFELERRIPDVFVPKYSMVMFRNIPYHVVKKRGEQQEILLERLIGPAGKLAEIDLQAAETFTRRELAPIAAEPSF
jgi:kynurenine 3-monooxygenase